MSAGGQPGRDEPGRRRPSRVFADEAFSRAAGAPLLPGNCVRLLKDARENYPAWLDAIGAAKQYIHFESYLIHEDNVGREFADALIAKARQGVRVRVVYDWMGGFGKTSRGFWNRMREAGVEVRCYNRPRLDSPFGWLSRDHRKTIVVDGRVAFVGGLCVGRAWTGDPARKIPPWRDTGVEVRGKAVAAIGRAFAQIWAGLGEPISEAELTGLEEEIPAGGTNVRVVATVPMTAGISRVDELAAGLAREKLWLTDAYYAGMTSYVQALKAAARDGVDVRLLVPGGTDIPILRPLSRAGYRPLLAAGVRVFEWNGPMLHAKTALADRHWARVGSSNLNVSSWFGNCEMDLVIEDEPFAREMEEMYLNDLTNSTEIVLDTRNKVRAPGQPSSERSHRAGGGSAGRVAAGALRIGSAVGAAFTNRRVFEPVEVRILTAAGALLIGLAILLAFFPAVLVYPAIVLFSWMGGALIFRAWRLRRKRKRDAVPAHEPAAPGRAANPPEEPESGRN